jgi:hypothetical protein
MRDERITPSSLRGAGQRYDPCQMRLLLSSLFPWPKLTMCSQTDVTEELALSLQPLMYDVKYCSPTKFTFVLLLSETEHFIEKLPKMCFPIAPFAHTYYLNVVLAEIVRLFRLSNEETQCDYLTIWDNQQLSERILSSVELVSKKGQVTVENGVLRAKLLPLI